jgi:uncharacterized protein with HEPN domain
MSRHDDRVSPRQMIDHVEEAVLLAGERTRADLGTDRVFALALLKLVEIVCEAGTRVSESVKIEHSDIPWRAIAGTRNHLIHGYDGVDDDILWNIVTVDFPPLAVQIRTVLQTRGWA